MMKNAFYFILKALFAFEIFRLLSLLFGYVEKGLDKKAKINFNFFRVTDWTTKIAMHKLLNISRKKDNQKMWEKLVPGPFKKNKFEHIKSQKCYKFCSYFMSK